MKIFGIKKVDMAKNLIVFIIVSNFFLNSLSAECLKPVTHLNNGDTTQCEGYLFTLEKELEVRIKISNYDNLMLINLKNQELIDILNKRVDNQIQQNINLQNQIDKQTSKDFWEKTLFFGLGVLTTILTLKIASEVVK